MFEGNVVENSDGGGEQTFCSEFCSVIKLNEAAVILSGDFCGQTKVSML